MPLKMYCQKPRSPQFWEEHRREFLQRNSLERFCHNASVDSVMTKVFENCLPQDGKIIEASCDLGQYVFVEKKRLLD